MSTVARRHGVIHAGGSFPLMRAAPALRAARPEHCLFSADSAKPLFWQLPRTADAVRVPIQSPSHATYTALSRGTTGAGNARSGRTLGQYTIKQKAGMRQGRHSGCFGSDLVASATRSGPILIHPGAPSGRVPRPAAVRSKAMRASDWRNGKHDAPVLPCDCDLRFSFP